MIRALQPVINRCVAADGYSPSNEGDGIRAAMWVGARKDADSAPMIFDRGAILPGETAGYTSDGDDARFVSSYNAYGQLGLGSQPFMKVNRKGKRFANESTPYDFICFAASEQPGGVWAQILDSNCKEDVMRFSTIGCSKLMMMQLLRAEGGMDEAFAGEIERGFIIKADTIEELATGLGFEGEAKDNFLAEVDRYNEFNDKQNDEDFGKEAFRLSAIKEPPFYGCWYGGTLLTTIDGLTINENLQVLDENIEPIEGLYAVGDCSGSLFSSNYPGYIVGCACGRTITFGRQVIKMLAQ